VRQRLNVGQEVDFWNLREDRLRRGRFVRFKPDQLLVQTETPAQHWWVSYAAIQLDTSQAPPPEPPARRACSDFNVGDTVGFL